VTSSRRGIGAALGLTVAFVALALLVELGGDSADTRILTELHDRVGESGEAALDTIDGLTDLPGLAVVAVAAVLWLVIAGRRQDAVFLVASVGGVWLLNPLVKELFQRPRPDLWPSPVGVSELSFPSGHAANTAALVAAVVLVVPAGRWRVLACLVGVAALLLVAYAELALGLHYPSDILAGWLWATAWVAWVRVVRNRATSRGPARQ
jgi:undecaprenyl-diphosphatase